MEYLLEVREWLPDGSRAKPARCPLDGGVHCGTGHVMRQRWAETLPAASAVALPLQNGPIMLALCIFIKSLDYESIFDALHSVNRLFAQCYIIKTLFRCEKWTTFTLNKWILDTILPLQISPAQGRLFSVFLPISPLICVFCCFCFVDRIPSVNRKRSEVRLCVLPASLGLVWFLVHGQL